MDGWIVHWLYNMYSKPYLRLMASRCRLCNFLVPYKITSKCNIVLTHDAKNKENLFSFGNPQNCEKIWFVLTTLQVMQRWLNFISFNSQRNSCAWNSRLLPYLSTKEITSACETKAVKEETFNRENQKNFF